jgi:hypothetical protein
LDIPFTIGIQTPIQVAWMLEFGHNRTLPMDATFGTNVQRYNLSIVIMFDHHVYQWHGLSQVGKFDSMVVTIEGMNCE